MAGVLLAVGVLVALLISFPWLSEVMVQVTGALIFLLLLLLLAIPVFWANNKKTLNLMKQGIRSGDTRVVFSEDGMQSHHDSGGQLVRWPYVTDIVAYRDYTLVMLSPMEFMPIPDAALPGGMTRAEFLERIASWRSQHPQKP